MLEIDTMNAAVHYDLVDAALAIPGSLAAGWADKESRWLDQQAHLPEQFLIEHKLGALVSHLAKNGETAAGARIGQVPLGAWPLGQGCVEDRAS